MMSIPTENLIFSEITDIQDDLFLDWLDLFETLFPANEKLLFSTLLKILKSKGQGEGAGMHMLAIRNECGKTVGMVLYQLVPDKNLVVLRYLGTAPSEQGKGLGTRIYRDLLEMLDPAVYQALIFEVEIPGHDQASQQAERRIQFYLRNGAALLEGIHYMQDIGWHQPQTPMHIMVHPLQPITPEQAFALAKSMFGDLVKQTGTLSLAAFPGGAEAPSQVVEALRAG